LGAKVFSIVNLVSKDFLKLVLISNLVAWPVAWWLMNRWLDNFAYRVDIGFTVFIVSALAGLFIAMATVVYHSLKSATSNPVKALKYE
jgi:putative ABC transport system permease protein